MKKMFRTLVGLSFGILLFHSAAQAEVSETQNKEVMPTGVILNTTTVHGTGSDDLAIGDPYANHAPGPQALAGHPDTQNSYSEECTDDRCTRAKNRQLSSPQWQPEKK